MADDGGDLLHQLDLILSTDPLIDEVGFLHPSQFTTLGDDISVSNPLQYDKSVFWFSDHKLAISTHVLPKLYNNALLAYKDARKEYATIGDNVVDCENEILKHSKILLILSCDFTSMWNSRKLVLSRKHILSLFMEEFQLSKLILSYSPKCDYAWSHRRWVIKMIKEQFPDLQEIVEKESELVKEIAEKSKMNYRAWNHRCWLVPYMTKAQAHNELSKSRKWAELHIGDNCCFHYRRQLMLRMLESSYLRQDVETSFNYEVNTQSAWKDELQWNESLIERYVGREALWVHRRFLSQFWIKHFCHGQQTGIPCLKDTHHLSSDLDFFLGKELQLMRTCQKISADGFEDFAAQAQQAASYLLWILKVSELKYKLREIGDLKAILLKTCPERTILWESLLS